MNNPASHVIPEKAEVGEALASGGRAAAAHLLPSRGAEPQQSVLGVVNSELAPKAAGQLRGNLVGVSGHVVATCLWAVLRSASHVLLNSVLPGGHRAFAFRVLLG